MHVLYVWLRIFHDVGNVFANPNSWQQFWKIFIHKAVQLRKMHSVRCWLFFQKNCQMGSLRAPVKINGGITVCTCARVFILSQTSFCMSALPISWNANIAADVPLVSDKNFPLKCLSEILRLHIFRISKLCAVEFFYSFSVPLIRPKKNDAITSLRFFIFWSRIFMAFVHLSAAKQDYSLES